MKSICDWTTCKEPATHETEWFMDIDGFETQFDYCKAHLKEWNRLEEETRSFWGE